MSFVAGETMDTGKVTGTSEPASRLNIVMNSEPEYGAETAHAHISKAHDVPCVCFGIP